MGQHAPLGISYNIMQYLKRNEDFELKHFSTHDLRRTARSNFSTLTEFHVAEIMLGHSIGRIVQTHDKCDYLEGQAAAYQVSCKRFFMIVDWPNPIANRNIVTLHASR